MCLRKNIFSIILVAILMTFVLTNKANADYKQKNNSSILANPLSSYMNDMMYLGTDNFSHILKSSLEENDLEELEMSTVSYSNEEKEEFIVHTVGPEDSLWNLAKRYYGNGMMYYYIMQVNNLTSTVIIDGTELIIPFNDNIIVETSTVVEQSTTNVSNKELEYIGNFKITGYDPWCKHCCSKTDGITASGVEAVIGRTVACNGIAMGTKIYIEGYGYYTVEDTGGMKNNVIDIACYSHTDCYSITNATGVNVYKVN